MAFSKVNLTAGVWTFVATANTLTFQNVGSHGIYINTTNSNTVGPTDTVGLYYDFTQGELRANVAALTASGYTNVWAKPSSGAGGALIVEI